MSMKHRKRSLGVAICALGFLLSCRPTTVLQNVTFAVPYELDTLDTQDRNNLANFALLSHSYEPLVTTDASMRIHPLLAESWENPDLSTWIMHLRKSVYFHSGKMLTPNDVVYS